MLPTYVVISVGLSFEKRDVGRDMDWRDLERFTFGDSPAMADKLAELVLNGTKRATCWIASERETTSVGERMVMCDGSGRPRAVLETVELALCRFDDVDAAFAYDEGEGDRSLSYWQQAHREFFGRVDLFAPFSICCSGAERFRLVEMIA